MVDSRPSRAGWSLLVSLLTHRRAALGRLACWSVVEALPALMSGRLLASAVDRGFLAGNALVGLSWLGGLGATMAVAAVASGQIFRWVGEVVEPVRDGLLRVVVAGALNRPNGLADRTDASGVARLTGQVETVRDQVGRQLLAIPRFVLTLVAATVGLLTLAPVVVLLVLPPLLAALVTLGYLLRVLVPRQQAVLLGDERVAATVGTIVSGVRDVVALGAERHTLAAAAADIDGQAAAARSLARAGAARTLVIMLGGQLPLVLILLAATAFVGRERLSVGTVLGAITYLTGSLEPAVRSVVKSVGGSGLLLAVTLRRIAESAMSSADQPTTAPLSRPTGARFTASRPGGYDLELRRVSFAYGANAEPVIRDLDLAIPHGTHLAVVGPSGIGKSTLANLLVGLSAPQHGQLRLGGKPMSDVDEGTLRCVLALIPQEAYVFVGSLRENLSYLRPNVSQRHLDRAVETFGLGPLVDRIGGYDITITPAELAAGERQLLAMLRTYLSTAHVVVLDEATCHLDPVAEARAEEAFARREHTLIVVAHRISSARRADQILLMDGVRTELGTHDDLLERSPLYADLTGRWDHRAISGTHKRTLRS